MIPTNAVAAGFGFGLGLVLGCVAVYQLWTHGATRAEAWAWRRAEQLDDWWLARGGDRHAPTPAMRVM